MPWLEDHPLVNRQWVLYGFVMTTVLYQNCGPIESESLTSATTKAYNSLSRIFSEYAGFLNRGMPKSSMSMGVVITNHNWVMVEPSCIESPNSA